MQPAQHRFREHERTCRQSMSGDRSDHTLADRVPLGACERRPQDFQAESANRIIQALREDPVPIVDQVLGPVLVADGKRETRITAMNQAALRRRVEGRGAAGP